MSDDEPSVLLFAGRFSVRGSCAYTLRLAEHLPSRGFRVEVVCPDARMLGRTRRRELNVHEFAHLNWPIWGSVVLGIMLKRLQANPPDLIHVQSRTVLRQARWIAKKLKIPLVLTVHDQLPPNESLLVDQSACRRIIAVSEPVKTDLIRRAGLPESLIDVIPSGVDRGSCERVEEVFGNTRIPVVGTAGPLEAVKGFPFFLRAAAMVLETGRQVEFLVAGAGPEESNLRRLARELHINDHVTFVPNLLDFDDALAAMDVFVLPSLQQGLGTTMLEAMALGRPVIATKVGGVFHVVKHGETGLLVPPSDSDSLSVRIMELLDNPEQARTIGRAARETVERDFNVDRMLDQTAALYREVLSEREQDVKQPVAAAGRR